MNLGDDLEAFLEAMSYYSDDRLRYMMRRTDTSQGQPMPWQPWAIWPANGWPGLYLTYGGEPKLLLMHFSFYILKKVCEHYFRDTYEEHHNIF